MDPYQYNTIIVHYAVELLLYLSNILRTLRVLELNESKFIHIFLWTVAVFDKEWQYHLL